MACLCSIEGVVIARLLAGIGSFEIAVERDLI